MIRPANFAYNPETAVNNKFQVTSKEGDLQVLALHEFDQFVDILRLNGVIVELFNDSSTPKTPDAVFPNNWVSFHEDGTVVLYPMFAGNRREERRTEILTALQKQYTIKALVDLSYFEKEDLFLEGTGSMVLDRQHKIAYLCLSPRSTLKPFTTFCHLMNYTPLVFNAVDANGFAIYHTNVMLCIGDTFAVICSEAIKNCAERAAVLTSLRQTMKEIVDISHQQMAHFAGNMLHLSNNIGNNLLVLSKQAYVSLTSIQLSCLEKHAKLLYTPLDHIEKNGGGSARCMLAELFLPLTNNVKKDQ
ncbi:arginine deiminase-related protein [Olivibacter ginsenosidimutans]|uniref:Arginine deiminase-related protein n=2 Tax=Olivibacter ginsenosidimutans TaxID=1176537 RepID=A0ABP9C6U2_9SPHI